MGKVMFSKYRIFMFVESVLGESTSTYFSDKSHSFSFVFLILLLNILFIALVTSCLKRRRHVVYVCEYSNVKGIPGTLPSHNNICLTVIFSNLLQVSVGGTHREVDDWVEVPRFVASLQQII